MKASNTGNYHEIASLTPERTSGTTSQLLVLCNAQLYTINYSNMASKQLGGVDCECRLPCLLPEPQLSSQSLFKQGVVSSAEGGVEPPLTTGRTALGGRLLR